MRRFDMQEGGSVACSLIIRSERKVTTPLRRSTRRGSVGSFKSAMRLCLGSHSFYLKGKNLLDEPISKQRLLRVMALGDVALVVLDKDTPAIERFNAAAVLRHRLREFNGALWVGVPLHERHAVINALRMGA